MTSAHRLSDGMPSYVQMAEEYLVGGAMLGLTASEVLKVEVDPRDFREVTLGVVWKAITNLAERGLPPTVPQVSNELLRIGWLDRVGAETFLVGLTGGLSYLYGNVPACTAHAAIVREWASKRSVIKQASETAKRAYEGKVVPIRGGVSLDVDERPAGA